MTDVQQVVATRGRHQIVILDGLASDAIDTARDRYAVTTLGGAVIHRDLTHDEAQALLARLWNGDGAGNAPYRADEPSKHSPQPPRALRMRR